MPGKNLCRCYKILRFIGIENTDFLNRSDYFFKIVELDIRRDVERCTRYITAGMLI